MLLTFKYKMDLQIYEEVLSKNFGIDYRPLIPSNLGWTIACVERKLRGSNHGENRSPRRYTSWV
jgi:hypothetical protein